MGALLGAVDVFATGTLPVWSSKKPVSQEMNLKLDRCRRSDVSEPGIMSLEPRNGSGVAFVFVVTASHPPHRRFWDSFSEHWRKDWLEFSTEAGKFQYYVCIIKCFYFLNFLLLSSFSNVVVTVHYFFFCPNLALPYSSRCRACPLQLHHEPPSCSLPSNLTFSSASLHAILPYIPLKVSEALARAEGIRLSCSESLKPNISNFSNGGLLSQLSKETGVGCLGTTSVQPRYRER